MPALSELIKHFSTGKDIQMSSAGRALWLVWDGELPHVVPKILEDYGGTCVMDTSDQALWFFFTSDVLLALARLKVWGKFNRLPLSAEVFIASFELNVENEFLVLFDPLLSTQEIEAPQDLSIYVHPKALEEIGDLPGLSFTQAPLEAGMTPLSWKLLDADPSLPYKSTQGWYAIVRPLGKPLDQGFQVGWESMYVMFDSMLGRLHLRYLLVSSCFIVHIASLRDLRLYVQGILELFEGSKSLGMHHWPCAATIMDHNNYVFNSDLLERVTFDWADIIPDTPCVTYRNAFLLGKGFRRNDLNFSASAATMDSWVILSLVSEESKEVLSAPVLIADQLLKGPLPPCFYCGAGNHPPSKCPTRTAPCHKENLWKKLAHTDMDSINESFRIIEAKLLEEGSDGYRSFGGIDTPTGLLVHSVFEINLVAQVRMIANIWETQAFMFPKAMLIVEEVQLIGDGDPPKKIPRPIRDDSPAWGLLERFLYASAQETISIEREISEGIVRNSRDLRLYSLQGFLALERGDFSQAMTAWKTAERVSNSSLLQTWHAYLQARLLEVQGQVTEAGWKYRDLAKANPTWLDANYRYLVCSVKRGFASRAIPEMKRIVEQNPYVFNRFLIDPELGRGYLCLLKNLYPMWFDLVGRFEAERAHVRRLDDMVAEWFAESDESVDGFRKDLTLLREIAQINNYVVFFAVVQAHKRIEASIKLHIETSIEFLKLHFRKYLKALEYIRDESSWFPFPKVLVEFNRVFNSCVASLNWAFSTDFNNSLAFKRAKEESTSMKDWLKELERRLTVLRIVRDGTLCCMLLCRTFFWVEAVGIFLCIIAVTTILLYGDLIGLTWLQEVVAANHWSIQSMLLIVVSLGALSISALRATLTFEKHRDDLLEEAREQRKELQRRRLEIIQKKRKSRNIFDIDEDDDDDDEEDGKAAVKVDPKSKK